MKKDKHRGIASKTLIFFAAVFTLVSILSPKTQPQKAENGGFSNYSPSRFILPYGFIRESLPPFITKKEEKPPAQKPAPTKIYMRNDTDYNIDLQAALAAAPQIEIQDDGVQVIIVHTHGTEAYTPHGEDTYKESDELRTLNEEQNMLRVGQELKTALESYGIKTAHCRTLCDYPNYNGAYDRSFDAIEEMLKTYPEAQIIIDLHRDAVLTADGGYWKATAEIDGKNAAQILFVVGTDAGGLKHPDWRENLGFALKLHCRLEEMYPGITRPINIRAARFNQHFKKGSMLVEMGTCANYLEEALYSARLLASAISDLLKNG